MFLSSQQEEQCRADASENQEENPVTGSNTAVNEAPEAGGAQNTAGTGGCEGSSGDNDDNKEEGNPAEINKEDEERKVGAQVFS